MNWQVGDRAIIAHPINHKELRGEICVIAGDANYFAESWLIINMDADGRPMFAHPSELKPIPDTYDGLQVTTWESCPFKPAVTV